METRKISLPYYIRQKPCEPAKGKAKAQQKASCSFLQPFIRQMHQVICHIRLIGAISGWHIFSLWLPVQQMAFYPSRLICKIKNFFDVFFTFFSYFLLELAGLKTHKKIQMPAGIMEMHPQAYLEEPPALPAAPLL